MRENLRLMPAWLALYATQHILLSGNNLGSMHVTALYKNMLIETSMKNGTNNIGFPTLLPCTWQIEPPSMACLGYKQWWWGWIMRLLYGLHIINMMQINPLLGCCWLERVNSVLAIKIEISSIFWKLDFFQFLCWNSQNYYIRVSKYWKWINNNIWGEEDK